MTAAPVLDGGVALGSPDEGFKLSSADFVGPFPSTVCAVMPRLELGETSGTATFELAGTPVGFAVATTVPVGPKVIGVLDHAELSGADMSGWLGSVALALPLGETIIEGPKIIGVLDGGGGWGALDTAVDWPTGGDNTIGGTPPVEAGDSGAADVGEITTIGLPPVEAGSSVDGC